MTAPQADLIVDRPSVTDGAALWRIAKDSGNLDLNSSYSYLLWCRA
ncbi:diaminobutyrate acetyltransferase, partial [Streptomyces sp. NPDC127079]